MIERLGARHGANALTAGIDGWRTSQSMRESVYRENECTYIPVDEGECVQRKRMYLGGHGVPIRIRNEEWRTNMRRWTRAVAIIVAGITIT